MEHTTVINNYWGCGCCCDRAMFPPDRPIILSITKESDVDFIVRFSEAVEDQKVVKRTLILTDSEGTREIEASHPKATSIAFSCVLLNDPTAEAEAIIKDTNSKGESLESNHVTFSIAADPPDVEPAPLQAPVILSVERVLVGGNKKFVRG